MTATEFLERRPDLPDSGRWTELVAGEPVVMDAPDQRHGDMVLHLSKAVAAVLRPDLASFAAFDLGIHTRSRPDTVRFPAMSVFAGGDRFAVLDAAIAVAVPTLVLEIASQNDRRRTVAQRVHEYHTHGVATVWIADPHDETVIVLHPETAPVMLKGEATLTAPALLPGFAIPITQLFSEPVWWRGKR